MGYAEYLARKQAGTQSNTVTSQNAPVQQPASQNSYADYLKRKSATPKIQPKATVQPKKEINFNEFNPIEKIKALPDLIMGKAKVKADIKETPKALVNFGAGTVSSIGNLYDDARYAVNKGLSMGLGVVGADKLSKGLGDFADSIDAERKANTEGIKKLIVNPNDRTGAVAESNFKGGQAVGEIAKMVVPYGVANKALGAIPAVAKIGSAFKSPVVGKIVQNAIIGTLANTAISTPQVIDSGMKSNKSAGQIVGDVALDTGINLIFDTLFAGFESKKVIADAMSSYRAGKIAKEELDNLVSNEAKAIIDTPTIKDALAKYRANEISIDELQSIVSKNADVATPTGSTQFVTPEGIATNKIADKSMGLPASKTDFSPEMASDAKSSFLRLDQIKPSELKQSLKSMTNPISDIKSVAENNVKKAQQDWEDAIEEVRNHFKTSDLRVDEYNSIKSELGIDLEQLSDNYIKAENDLNNLGDFEKTERSRQAYGVLTPDEEKYFDAVGKQADSLAIKNKDSTYATKDIPQDRPFTATPSDMKQINKNVPPKAETPAKVKSSGQNNTVMPKGEKVNMNAPAGMETRRVSERIVADETQPIDVRKSVAEDFNSYYDVYSDKKAVEQASNFVSENGNNVDLIIGNLQRGNRNKGDIATGIQIYDNIKFTQPEKASKLMAELAIVATEAGQISQAYSLLKTMGDGGFDYMTKKQIAKINEQMTAKFGNKFKKIEVDDTIKALLEKRAKATTDELKEEIGEELSKYIGSKIPSTKIEKIMAFRHFAMLANPKTHIRNIVGNTIMGVVSKGKDVIGTGLEKALVQKAERTKFINYKLRNPDIIPEVKRAKAEYLKHSGKDVKYEKGLGVSKDQKVFTGGKENPNIIEKGLQKAVDINYAFLQGEDNFFSGRHFENALGSFMSARGLKEATPEAIEFASKQAQKLTFQDESKLANAISRLSKSDKKGVRAFGVGIDAVVPFKKTPINIAKRTVEYSPIGLVKGIRDRITQVKAGNITAAEAVDEIAAGLTGTGIGLLGFFFAANGFVTGSPDKDKDKAAFDLASGKLPFALKLGDKYYSYDWSSPVGAMIATGAAVFDSTKTNQDIASVILDAGAAEIDSLFNSSVFKGIRDTFAGRYGQNPSDSLYGIGRAYALSFIPAVSGTAGRAIDDTVRTTYYQTDAIKKFGEDIKNKAGFSQGLQPKVDTRGNEIKRIGNPVFRTLYEGLSPAQISQYKPNEIDNEIERVYKQTQDNAVFPKVTAKSFTDNGIKYTLTPKEATQFQKTQGQKTYEYLQKRMNQSIYKNAKDEYKSKYIYDEIDRANEEAKAELIKARGGK